MQYPGPGRRKISVNEFIGTLMIIGMVIIATMANHNRKNRRNKR